MKACVVYFSRTGNTKLMAQTLSKLTQAQIFDIANTRPELIKNFDVVLFGTPVEGFRPAKETLSFVKDLLQTKGKKAILFCTYALWKGTTFRTLSKILKEKGYECILTVSKRKVTAQTDFSDITEKVEKTLDRAKLANWLTNTNETKKKNDQSKR
jgi:flavodoxin